MMEMLFLSRYYHDHLYFQSLKPNVVVFRTMDCNEPCQNAWIQNKDDLSKC